MEAFKLNNHFSQTLVDEVHTDDYPIENGEARVADPTYELSRIVGEGMEQRLTVPELTDMLGEPIGVIDGKLTLDYIAPLDVTEDGELTVRTASATETGVVQVGDGLTISDDGVLSVSGDEAQVYAVYCADDESLTFFERAEIPAVGDVALNGKTVTQVYTQADMNTGYLSPTLNSPISPFNQSTTKISMPYKHIYFYDRIHFSGSAYGLFSHCSEVLSLDASGLDTSNVADMGGMFFGCLLLTSLDVSGFDTSKVTDMGYMFYNCPKLTSLDVSGFDTSKVTDMNFMFYNCASLASLDVSGFDTSNVTEVVYAFSGCTGLLDLNVSGFDTSNVTDMRGMFNNCPSLTSLDVSGFDTSKVTDMNFMFYNCASLASLDVSGFGTSNVTNMSGMFCNCKKLTELDVSGFNTLNVTNIGQMFSSCAELTSLDVSGFDTSNVTNMTSMFNECTTLTTIGDVSSWDTARVTNMNKMFYNCKVLTADCSTWNVDSVTYHSNFATNASGVTSPSFK